MKAAIRQRALELGFDDCRFTTAAPPASAARLKEWLAAGQHGEMGYLVRNAEKRVDPQRVLSGAKSVICLMVSYAGNEVLPHPPEAGVATEVHGRIARYACFADYHDVLGERLRTLAAFVDQLSGEGARSLWYVDTGPVLERDLAQRAGIGFIGKHTNVISRKLGNWTFLAEILTTIEIAPDEAETNRCGSCTRCLAACPTKAITAPFHLDARLCVSYLTIELKGSIPVALRHLIGDRIYGCDDCLAACPWNRFAREGQMMRPHARPDFASSRLADWLSLDDAGFKAKFSGTPIWRTKRRGFLRNVCVALGNTGNVKDLPALTRACSDPEPLIAEHASWAREQIEARAR